MCHCRACDKEIEVKWWVPVGTKTPILENLCHECLAWAEIAKSPGPLLPPGGKRKPLPPFLGTEYDYWQGEKNS